MKILVRDYLDESKNLDISGCSIIDFGEGQEKISVVVRDGKVEVRCEHGQLVIRPRVSNVIIVSAED